MGTLTRRAFLVGMGTAGAAAVLGTRFILRAQPAEKRMRLILLGTGGGPRVTVPGRSKPATLLLINGTPYVVDCGEGVAQQLVRFGVPLNTLRYVFITHHHSDHNLDFGNLVYNAWVTGLRKPVDAYGPPPLAAMAEAFWQLNRFDVETRIADEGRPDPRKMLIAHEFTDSGLVMQNADVKVTAQRVRHPPITHAYAFRFDGPGRSIVISGDTAYSPELIGFAKGADVLVHEVMNLQGIEKIIKRLPNATTLREHLIASHTLEEDVGKVAAEAGVKTLVLSHFVPADDPDITEEMWAAGVRKHFSGQIIVGRDLMEI